MYKLVTRQRSYAIGDRVTVRRVYDGELFENARVSGLYGGVNPRIRVRLDMFGDDVIVYLRQPRCTKCHRKASALSSAIRKGLCWKCRYSAERQSRRKAKVES